MKAFLKNNFLVLSMYLITLIIASYYIYNYDKTAINVYLNQYVGNAYANAFFFYITYFGDGLIGVLLLLAIMLTNVRIGLYTAFTFLTSTVVAYVLKRFYFHDVNRPWYVYQWLERHPITYVEGVDLHLHYSFPSGHATQAFAIGMCLSFILKNPGLKFLVFLIALFTSMSRVYLSQHWLIDITAGSIIGSTFSIIYYYIFIHKDKFQKLDRSLFSFTAT